jgi:cytochrome bd ubiquinol oxidase subunit II
MALAAALVGLVALVIYAVLGGADFGGGVWDLLATGPRAGRQRTAISDAIGPVWEANHVWLIFALVLLFTCFPPAFAAIGTGLYVPLSLALVGVVFRGAAFVFRNYAADVTAVASTWTVLFGISSLAAPFFFGDAIGALATGRYAAMSAFAIAVGLFAVAVCAQIAAVFMLREVREPGVQQDFRRRALRATLAVWILGLVPCAIAAGYEPSIVRGLLHPLAVTAIAVALVAGVVTIVCVARRQDSSARVAVGVEAAAILAGWFGAQAPELVPNQYTFASAASPDATIAAFLVATAVGAMVLVPSLLLLFRVFKRA